MPEVRDTSEITLGEERSSMLETALLLLFCLLIGVLSLAIVVWVVLSGRLFYLDGLLLTLISLSIGVIFILNVAWSVRTGEVRAVLDYFRKKSAKSGVSSDSPAEVQK